MKSKTSFFNRTIALDLLKRFWPLFASYFLLWLLIVPLSLNTTIKWALEAGSDAVLDAENLLLNAGHASGGLMAFFFGIFFAMAAFHYLYNNRSVSQMACLPVRREGVFLSVFLPGLAVMLLSNLLTFLIAILVASSYGVAVAGYAMQALGMVCLMTLFFYGFGALCAMLTGHILVLPAVYVVLNFTVVVALTFIYAILNKIVYGLNMDGGYDIILTGLSPLFHILTMTGVQPVYDAGAAGSLGGTEVIISPATIGYSYNGWIYLFIIAAVGIIMAVCAVLLIKRRRMETAGDVVAVKPLKPVFKYCLSVGCSLVIGLGLYYSMFSYRLTGGTREVYFIAAFMLIGAFIGYFAAEMMIQKTLRVFAPHKWKGLGVVALVLIALICACEFDLFGYERRIPELSEVERVEIYGYNGEFVQIENAESIQAVMDLHSSIIANKKAYEQSEDQVGNSFYLQYALKDGSYMFRKYTLYYDAKANDIKTLQDFLNAPEIILLRKNTGADITERNISDMYVNYFDEEELIYTAASFTAEEAYQLYTECILPDMKDGTIGLVWLGDYAQEYDRLFTVVDIYYHLAVRSDSGEYLDYDFAINPTSESSRTNAWLAEHGITALTRKDAEKYSTYDEDLTKEFGFSSPTDVAAQPVQSAPVTDTP